MKKIQLLVLVLSVCISLHAREIHVSVKGNDVNEGTFQEPLKTIAAASRIARAGDVITVHAGTYREQISPLFGGTSNENRITYQAADGERVYIKGSEIINKWTSLGNGVWQIKLANLFFGRYNPYKDLIYGDWFMDNGRIHHTGEVYLNSQSLYEVENIAKVTSPKPLKGAQDQEASTYVWYCESNEDTTTILANFHAYDPNKELVEINTRQSCFYPEKTGINYITIRGFDISQSASQWSAPTAEQIGMIGTNWSKGWIIEDNVVHDAKCSGITLGKDRATGQDVWSADKSKDGSQHYNEVIFRALEIGWNKNNIGSHIVRNNTIYNCEQTGICGSLGAVFSQITNNHIYNVWTKRQFWGWEIAGIKIHGAVDVLIKGNRLHNCYRGIWMDWMAQGTRVSCNLFYGNDVADAFFEVNHGPFLVDNNIMCSSISIKTWSQGGAYVHNLIEGKVLQSKEPNRFTPYLLPHSTKVAGLINIIGGDDRYYNNVFAVKDTAFKEQGKYGLAVYDGCELPVWMVSNLYLEGAKSYKGEVNSIENKSLNPRIKITDRGKEVFLQINVDESFRIMSTQTITTSVLGKTKMSGAYFENPDGSPLKIDTDYFGGIRPSKSPFVGPFKELELGEQTIRVW